MYVNIRPVQKVSSHVIWKIETFIEEDTRYKKQETLYIGNDASVPFKVGTFGTSHSSLNCHQMPRDIFLNLIDGLKSFPF